MELKLGSSLKDGQVALGFNRTFMELKPKKQATVSKWGGKF